MRVLQFISSMGISSGGTTSYIQLLASHITTKIDLHIVTSPTDDEVSLSDVTIHHLSWSNLNLCKMKSMWLNLLRKINPDIVHVNGCWLPQDALTIIWSKTAGYSVALTTHGMLDPTCIGRNYWTRKLPALIIYQKRALNAADVIIATSEEEKEHIAKFSNKEKIRIVPIGIELEDISPRNDWNQNKKILTLSRIHPIKGLENFISAIDKCRNSLKDYCVQIVGNGDVNYINDLKNLVDKLNLSSIISFTGSVYGKEKYRLYKEADFFVSSSFSENFGLSIAEALASGTPVIATKGTPWMDLERFYCGMWIDADYTSLAKAITAMTVKDDGERKQMGLNARKLIQDKYSSESMGNNIINIYNNII
jgi:glycosyltransferase involved in cell wall biosynthesis